MKLELENPRLLSDLEPFVVATADNQDRFDLSPFELPILPEHRLDPLRMSTPPFLEILKKLDEVTFGPEGMPMPRWVFFDGAELPGGIVGFGKRASQITEQARSLLSVPDGYRGLVPYSMFIAIPTFERSVWMGHNLASVASHLPDEGLNGLGSLTKAVGLRAFRATRQVGATQWDTHALCVHTRLGPLELLTAWTPAHGEPWTLTYLAEINDETLMSLARDRRAAVELPAPDFWIESSDHDSMQQLQARIERGERFCIAGRPERGAGGQRVPVALLPRR